MFFQRSGAAEVGCPNSSPFNFITSRLEVICSFPSRDIPSLFGVFPCHLLGTQALVLILLGSVLCEHFCPPDFGIAADERWKPYLVATRHRESCFLVFGATLQYVTYIFGEVPPAKTVGMIFLCFYVFSSCSFEVLQSGHAFVLMITSVLARGWNCVFVDKGPIDFA